MKDLIIALGFSPKENTNGIFTKTYHLHEGYRIDVDFEAGKILYGEEIKSESKTTQNFSQSENWVVLECVDRLLEKGYRPKDITLEKTFQLGHNSGGRLDIFIEREWKAYLMIECKTWWKEFDKEWTNTKKNGGQLFSYFQQDTKTEFLVLYASEFDGKEIHFRNEIIKIEPDYRLMGNVVDLYNRWNKFTKQNGIFETWAKAYHFESKALTLGDLTEIRQEDSSFIFNRFLEILRHNAVSDKPNAFNKIFTLFLCKIKDEDKQRDEELDFQWKEGEDDSISFQKRLSDLYKSGMNDFLNKKISDLSDKDFNGKYAHLGEADRINILHEITKIRLQKNNEFAIKEVFDEETFEENSKVLKEVVELLQNYRFRYAKKQPFLGDFFELLLTTGLKQESGQFFTPVPIARFICKSVPMRDMIEKKLRTWNHEELLPNVIDYAAGSGHFLTEAMEELQNVIGSLESKNFPPSAQRELEIWKNNPFVWAYNYIYGVELDYRLVKTTKVGCYLHGDGVANVIHGDGLDNFMTGNYLWKLKKNIPGTQDNWQFDFVLSNPPYSVSACKGNLKNKTADKDFMLYGSLTDQSSQIESLFIERTKQLLSEKGVAAIVLPSSILSSGGIYAKTRELLFKYFEFVAIVELGSGTFMATGTNTVVLFLRRRSNYDAENIETCIQSFFQNPKDFNIKINFSDNLVLENGFSKYVSRVWNLPLSDYASLVSGTANDAIKNHEIYVEYSKKLKIKNEKEWLSQVLTLEKEKLLYFFLTYNQEIVLVKSGDKNDEKNFLGYEFSNRKGDEGIHAIKKWKLIDDCTLLFDPVDSENPEKVNTYILDAFHGRHVRPIPLSLTKHIMRANLGDMLTLDRGEFEKNLSLSVKKKISFESKWGTVKLSSVCIFNPSRREIGTLNDNTEVSFIEMSSVSNDWKILVTENRSLGSLKKWGFTYFRDDDIILAKITPCMENGKCALVKNLKNGIAFGSSEFHVFRSDKEKILPEYLFLLLNREELRKVAETNMTGASGHRRVPIEFYETLDIPLPPLDIQRMIVDEIEMMEKRKGENEEKLKQYSTSIRMKADDCYWKYGLSKLGATCHEPMYGANQSAIEGIPEMDYRYIRITDINENGKLNSDWKTAEVIENKFILKEGDILFARSGATAGKTFFYKESFGKALFAGYLIRFQAKAGILDAKFLNFILKSKNYQNWVLDTRSGTAQPNINAQQYSSFEIPLPSFQEQQSIVSEIEKIEIEAVKLEEELADMATGTEIILKKYL